MTDAGETSKGGAVFTRVLKMLCMPRACIGILLLSILFASAFAGPIRRTADRLMPSREIALTVQPGAGSKSGIGQAVLLRRSSESGRNLYDLFIDAALAAGWTEDKAVSYPGYDRMAVGPIDGPSPAVRFSAPVDPGAEMVFLADPGAGILSVAVNGKTSIVDLSASIGTDGTVSIFPYSASPLPFIAKGLLFLCLTVLFFLLFLMAIVWIDAGFPGRRVLQQDFKGWYVWILFLLVYVYCFIAYQSGIPSFLEVGDQLYYWTTDNYVIGGKFDLTSFARSTVVFRGYLCHAAPFVAQKIGAAVHLDPVYVYFLFTAGTASFLLGYVIPEFHHLFFDKRAKLYSVCLYVALFSFFWQGMYTAVLVDLPGVAATAGGLLFLFRFVRCAWFTNALPAGVLLAAGVQFRAGYMLTVWLVAAGLVLYTVLIALPPIRSAWERGFRHPIALGSRRAAAGLLVGTAMFLIVCIPQWAVNQARGESGFIPSDREGSFGVEGHTLSELSANETLTNIMAGYPFPVSVDRQVASIKTQYTDSNSVLTLNQLLDMFVSRPLDTLTYIGKKLFLGFDVKTSVTYPDNGFNLAFSTLNYTVLACSLYALFRLKSSIGEKMLYLVVFLSIVLPQTLVHVEWRYFIAGYLVLYYLFAYRFSKEMSEPGRLVLEIRKGFLYFASAFLFMAQCVNLTLYA